MKLNGIKPVTTIDGWSRPASPDDDEHRRQHCDHDQRVQQCPGEPERRVPVLRLQLLAGQGEQHVPVADRVSNCLHQLTPVGDPADGRLVQVPVDAGRQHGGGVASAMRGWGRSAASNCEARSWFGDGHGERCIAMTRKRPSRNRIWVAGRRRVRYARASGDSEGWGQGGLTLGSRGG